MSAKRRRVLRRPAGVGKPAAARAEAGSHDALDALTHAVGTKPTYAHQAFSPEGVSHAAAFRPRPSDVFILTPPKTGTTWMQMLCHALRTGGKPLDFQDIYQVVPWDQMAWDLNQDLNAEQVATPRLFKTHQRLSSINHGAKYICLIRDVEDVLLSWWHFLRQKDVPPLRKYTSPSEFAFDDDFFAGGMRFGASIWEYYAEFFKALQLSDVLVLCYEDLVDNLESHLDVVAAFLGGPAGKAAARQQASWVQVLQLCSRESMAAHASRFDESWTYQELRRVGRMRDPSSFVPAPRVNSQTRSKESGETVITEVARKFLCDRWRDVVFSGTGVASYAELREAVRAELESRRQLLMA